MRPITISEQMMYSTVKIMTETGTGTGFVYSMKIDNNNFLVIVTNKHVLNYNNREKLKISFHVAQNDEPVGNIEINLEVNWYFHSSLDLAITPFVPIIDFAFKELNKKIYYRSISEDMVYSKEKLFELSALEQVVMVGYPIGLCDTANNLPLFRTGYTSNHPAIDFNSKSIGVVDMACFPGSSGSPIFILNENGYTTKAGVIELGTKRCIFLGILFQGPRYMENGIIKVAEIPTSQFLYSETSMMINLGYYIKANELDEFKNLFKQKNKINYN